MYPELDVVIEAYFDSVYPNEGVVFIKDNTVIYINNIHPEPHDNFYVDGSDYLRIKPDAIAHSHPSGDITPSESDAQLRRLCNIPMGIYGHNTGHTWI